MNYPALPELVPPPAVKPAFGPANLQDLINRGETGFLDTQGFHIYCELRPKSKLESAETDANALRYLQVIEEYANHGTRAADQFGVTLLELQGNVLHFYKEGAEDPANVIAAIQFVYLFTTTLYDELKPGLGDDWDGFASCVEHGRSIIVHHGRFASASVVSLGPAANEPAKQLFYGKTLAGCIDVPSRWAKELGFAPGGRWTSIKLINRDQASLIDRVENREARAELLASIRAYRRDTRDRPIQNVSLLANRRLFEGTAFKIEAPHRIQAFCLRPDLDGFSAVVKKAFEKGGTAVSEVALSFADILAFGDYMQRSTPGSVRLPWAGDCATLLVPPSLEGGVAVFPRWIEVAILWQNFAKDTLEGREKRWANEFADVRWVVGACHGLVGMIVVAPIHAQSRTFLVGAGWPVATSLDAQNVGKGGDIVTHDVDYGTLNPSTQKLFARVQNTEFWKTTNLNRENLTRAALEAGRAKEPRGEDYHSKYASIQVPPPRPHCR